MYVCLHTSSSSSSCHAANTDLPESLSSSFTIVHCSWEVFKATYYIGTEVFYIGSSWSSCLCSSTWWGPLEHVAFEFVPTSPAMSRMSGLSNLIVFVMDCRWLYSCWFVGCCLQNLFNVVRCIFVKLPSSFFSIRLINVHVVHPYSSFVTTAAWKRCLLFYRSGLTSILPIAYRSCPCLC